MKEVQDSKDGTFAILNYSKKIGEMLQRNGVEVFTFSSWCGFPLYEIDFGWGKPRWISVTNTPFKNGIMMMDTKEGNGIEVWVNLEEDVMAIFEQDHDLLAYCSPGTYGADYPDVFIGVFGSVTLLYSSRGCLGCCTKTPFVTTDNKLTENLGKGQLTRKRSIFEDFCSSSTYEMDYSLPQSQISASSTSNAAVDAQCWSGSNPSEFVNRGLLLWNQTRQQWIGTMAPEHNKKTRQSVISWNATYDNLLGSNKPFSRPIPLPEMVTFLVDIWEQEGLYD
ncbi:hypothetical protein R6Q59_030987 [Mikania micrantha]